jgi:hypothetical protein
VLLWMPQQSTRALAAGPDGLTYLTVHRRRAGVVIGPRPPDADPVERLTRWELFGGAWQVVDRGSDGPSGAPVTISLCRCDGGEELERLTSSDARLLDWLGDRGASTD